MAIRARIQSLDFRQLFILSGVFISKPWYIIPTYRATRQTVKICNSHFGKLHHKNNKTNAFRHALWNFLIAKNCFKVSGSVEKAIRWSKRITDLHEDLSPNPELARKMDLHNNAVGRRIFKDTYDSRIDIIGVLKIRMEEAQMVRKHIDLEKAGHKLVYMEDLHHER